MASFTDRHVTHGIVTNQDPNSDGWGMEAPFVSVSTCDRLPCIQRAQRYVAAETNSTATYYERRPEGWQEASPNPF